MARPTATPEQQSVRVLKVGERVRHILSELLARGEVLRGVSRGQWRGNQGDSECEKGFHDRFLN